VTDAAFKPGIAFLHRLADASAAAILPHFRVRTDISNKAGEGEFDPVTAADRGAEEVIREIITREYPEHGIVGEEYGTLNPGAEYQWYIDPIDGTRAFITGSPMWGTLIGLTHAGRPVIGIMNQPYTGERFWGDGASAFHRDTGGERPLRTRACASLGEAILTATTPDMFKSEDGAKFERLAGKVRLRRFGGDCYAYGLLAMGFIDAVVEASLKPFDIIPLIPIIEGAGGAVSGWDASPAASSSRVAACGDRALLPEVLRVLGE
jgi:histidinol phosphatase-like enzyme (inositol monophosphatase family)